MNKFWCMISPLLLFLAAWPSSVPAAPIERKILKFVASKNFREAPAHRTCRHEGKFVVYLIDNFEQPVRLVPELTTTHGELLRRILKSGRDDIIVKALNTSLTRGLATVIDDLSSGGCADAVISATPGSNYTYPQINSLFSGETGIRPDTILNYRHRLIRLMQRIALKGFPSAEWIQQIDVNPSKLMNDARKILFAQALGRYKIPIIIPYGNADTSHMDQIRSVNILSTLPHVNAYSALDHLGRRIAGFPYSPLSDGDEQAVYHIREMPDDADPFLAHLDINDDGFADYTFRRTGKIAFRNKKGMLAFAPPVLPENQFERLKAELAAGDSPLSQREMVLTAAQYRALGFSPQYPMAENGYIWLNAGHSPSPFRFKAVPWIRGTLTGTSFIPPNKVKELLSLELGNASDQRI